MFSALRGKRDTTRVITRVIIICFFFLLRNAGTTKTALNESDRQTCRFFFFLYFFFCSFLSVYTCIRAVSCCSSEMIIIRGYILCKRYAHTRFFSRFSRFGFLMFSKQKEKKNVFLSSSFSYSTVSAARTI